MKILYVIASTLLMLTNSANIFANDNPSCISCHQQAQADWQQSHHAHSMAIADRDGVIGDFNQIKAQHFGQTASFYQKDNQYWVSLTQNNQRNDYLVKYSFGIYPLQQYLVSTKKDRLQVFPFAWDARPKDEGGQRWYANVLDEDIQPNDRLHWQQPLQNWNGMCADCHSDELVRQYNTDTGSFNTQFSQINVGCVSCHGNKNEQHSKQELTKKTPKKDTSATDISHWQFKNKAKTATWQGPPRNNDFMQTCFACHSLRSPLTDGFTAGKPFLDQFSPTLIDAPLYFADGQIKEEVFEYGSFSQSKMFQAGVNCLDCHDKHTLKVKTKTNGLCLQCHNQQQYQQKLHHQHQPDSAGAQCVNCHMPTQRYMGVDDRRDHKFSIPRPDLSSQYQQPNACIQCHHQQTNQWAEEKLQQWHGKPEPLALTTQYFMNMQSRVPLSLSQHLTVINDSSLSEIKRASAVLLLAQNTNQLTDAVIKPWVNSSLPLMRLATAKMGYLLSDSDKRKSYQGLLSDRYRAVRVAAAEQLVNLTVDNSDLLKRAFIELTLSNQINSWRGEGNINASMLAVRQGNKEAAIKSLHMGIRVDPYFDASYVNLADIYRQLGEPDNETSSLDAGLTANPGSAILHFSKGMSLVRKGDKNSALTSFKRAMELVPLETQYAYLYFIALDSLGNTKQALLELKSVIKRYPNAQPLINLGLSFSQSTNDIDAYHYFTSLQKR